MTGHEVALVAVAALIVTVSHYAWAWAGFQFGKRKMAERYSAEVSALVVANNEHIRTVMGLEAKLRAAIAQVEMNRVAVAPDGDPN